MDLDLVVKVISGACDEVLFGAKYLSDGAAGENDVI